MSLLPTSEGGTIAAWQCIGCGRIEAPRDCIGVCEYRKVTLAAPDAQEALAARLAAAEARGETLAAVLQKIARTTPREGGFERTWRALQVDARKALAGDASE